MTFALTYDCGHPAGCTCDRRPLAKVPCGYDTVALCAAASRVRDGFWIKGAPTHVLAELLNELKKDGFVLAKESASEPIYGAIQNYKDALALLRGHVDEVGLALINEALSLAPRGGKS